jgi:hypothetical protein
MPLACAATVRVTSRNKILEAAENRPVSAIQVEDTETGERIFP